MDVPILALAIVLDIAFGELPNRLHPVAWLGKLISLEERLAPRAGAAAQFSYGIGMVVVDVGLFALPAYWLMRYLEAIPAAYIVVGALLLKISFSMRFLMSSARGIKNLLAVDKLDESRSNLRVLVSRDTSSLDKPHLVSATIESVAENTSDSFVAPLFYFLILGIPGAIAYRVVNTLDAMVGYHGQYEYLGKAAARLDDALNYIPSRITAILLVVSAFLRGKKHGANSRRILRRDHDQTESPNAGWPMSAMAGALGVRLEKEGFYQIGDDQGQLECKQIDSSLVLMLLTVIIWSIICLALGVVRFAYFS